MEAAGFLHWSSVPELSRALIRRPGRARMAPTVQPTCAPDPASPYGGPDSKIGWRLVGSQSHGSSVPKSLGRFGEVPALRELTFWWGVWTIKCLTGKALAESRAGHCFRWRFPGSSFEGGDI